MIATIIKYIQVTYKNVDAKIGELLTDDTNYNLIYENCKKILVNSMIIKLSIQNPDKKYISNDIEKFNIIKNSLFKFFDIQPPTENDKMIITKIINFYCFLSDNICLNTFEEFKKLLLNLKKMSLLLKIYKLIK